jgi:phage gp45-like
MEDEDYFKFSDEVLMNSTEKLLFGDTGTYIHQSADGVLDLVSDTEIEINATTIDINGAVAMDGAITGATNITLSGELDAATLDISGNADIDRSNSCTINCNSICF